MAPHKTKPPRKRRRVDNATSKSPSQRVAKKEGIIQSLELMKIALHACLATLFYVRELLPQYVFDWRQLPDLHPGELYSYDEFIRGKKVQENKRKHQRIRMMKRGMDDAADGIMDLLEEDIFDALVRRSLAAVQFSIMTDKKRPDTAVETYTITMGSAGRYASAVGLGVELDYCFDEDVNAMPVAEVGKDIASMDRNLAMLVDAPEIYGARTLGIELFYTSDSPEKYRVRGFRTVDSDLDSEILLFPVDMRWARVSKLYGLINCGFHTAFVRVSWLQCQCRPKIICGKNGVIRIENLKPVRLRALLKPPLAFEEVVLRESEFSLPWADEVVGGEDSLSE